MPKQNYEAKRDHTENSVDGSFSPSCSCSHSVPEAYISYKPFDILAQAYY